MEYIIYSAVIIAILLCLIFPPKETEDASKVQK